LRRLFQSPRTAKHDSSLDLRDPIVPAGLDDLAIETPRPKHPSDDFLAKSESIRDDQSNLFQIHSAGKIPKDRKSILVA
jgi:hypothetical protein